MKATNTTDTDQKHTGLIDNNEPGAKVPTDVLRQRHKLINVTTTVKPTEKDTKKQKTNYAERATQKVIQLIEEGNPAWRRTWGSYGFAKNFVTGNQYKGINFLFLNMLSPYPVPYYLTFKQVKELGGNVKRGSKAEWVYFYKKYFKNKDGKSISAEEAAKRDKAGEPIESVRFLRCYSVFNIECTEGVEWERPLEVDRSNNPIHECEVILEEMENKPIFELTDSASAFYSPERDIINVPDIKQFENSELFYRTTFHEVAHWTGHESRLGRKGIINCIKRDKDEYAEEELVAELASNIIMNLVGISNTDTQNVSAGYLKHWLKHLKQDPNFLFRVMPQAIAGAEYILGKPLHEIYEV